MFGRPRIDRGKSNDDGGTVPGWPQLLLAGEVLML